MRSLLVSLCCIAGCASQEVRLPEVVRIPVPVPCLERLPDAPQVTGDADLLALDDYRMVLTLARDRKVLETSYLELRAIAQACMK